MAGVLRGTWAGASAGTWNRHRAAVRSSVAWAGRPELADGLAAALEHRARSSDPAPGLTDDELAPLWDPTVGSERDRARWRLISETRAPITDVLALDVDQLDLAGHGYTLHQLRAQR